MKIKSKTGLMSIIHRFYFVALTFGGFGYIFYKERVFLQGIGSFIASLIFMLWLFWVINGFSSGLYIEDKGIRVKSFFGFMHFIKYDNIVGFTGSTTYGTTSIGIIGINYHFLPLFFVAGTESKILAQEILSKIEAMSGKKKGVLYFKKKRPNV